MRNSSKLLLLLLFASFIWGCAKDETANKPVTTLEVSLRNSEVYTHNFKISGDEEGATIKMQARHCRSSELIRNSSTNWCVVYQYQPEPGYTGNDCVEIETCTGGAGCGCSVVETVRINFTVTN